MRTWVSPVRALAYGMIAGAVGSAVQSLFFRATARVAPPPVPDAFVPPEPAQLGELQTETVARRIVEHVLVRELGPQQKERGGQLVHYAFGAAWGGLYGLACETWPSACSPLGSLAFGSLVWVVGDELLLPAVRLSGEPRAYPLATHAYAFAAHAVYGLAAYGAYALLRRRPAALVGAALWAARFASAAPVAKLATFRSLARARERVKHARHNAAVMNGIVGFGTGLVS
jgi:hypothetical protein